MGLLNGLKRLLPKKRKVHRDAGTGQFVTKDYAKDHPDTTVSETYKPHD